MRKVNTLLRNTFMLLAAVLVLTGGALSAKAAGLADARALSNGADAVGRVTENNPKVYFKYVATTSGYVSFSVRKRVLDTEDRKWEVEVFDRDANPVNRSCYGSNPSTQPIMVEKGTLLYVEVRNNYNTRDIDFLIRPNFTACATVVAEPNTSANNAKNVSVGSKYVGVMDKSGDEDFFRITAPESGYIIMDLSRLSVNSTETPSWKFSLYDSKMNELYSIYSKLGEDVHNAENVYYVLKKKQTVSVRVTNENSAAVGELYSFKTSFKKSKDIEVEGNNDFGKANKIKLKKTYLGVMGEPTADYFKVKTSGSGKYKVSMKLGKTVKYGYSIKVYDSHKKLIASTPKKIYKAGSVKFKAKGRKTYYVVVEHADYSWLFGGRTFGTMYKLKVSK